MDGEGSIVAVKRSRNGVSWRMSIFNTNYELLERIATVAGTGNIINHPRAEAHHKPSWYWACYGDNAKHLLRQLLPWLIVKRERAQEALGHNRG
jgi:hypothetical protein